MTRSFLLLFAAFLLPLFALDAKVSAGDPTKKALLVAVGDYPEYGGWPAISSMNDVGIIRKALMEQGFQEENIFVIRDEEGTKEGIINAVKTYLLDKVEAGDMVYFHFSGHGQQVWDDNGDEVDGLDEAIVPYDSPLNFSPGVYEGENLIRDDELGELFRELREKLTSSGHLLALLDACHSGTGTRGLAPARGTDKIMASKEYMKSISRGSVQEKGSFGETGVNDPDAPIAPMVAFFGAAHNQLNFETFDEDGNGVGSLSYAFSKKFSQAQPDMTYRGLFDQIKLEMSSIAPRQQPQAEGLLDQQVLGGKILGKPQYWKSVAWNDSRSITINAGWLQNINEGTKLGLFPADTRDFANTEPFAKGVVNFAKPLESFVDLDNEITQEEAENSWVYVLEQNFGKLGLKVRMELPEGPYRKAIEDQISLKSVIKIDSLGEVALVIEKDSTISLVTATDQQLSNWPKAMAPEVFANQAMRDLLAFTQAKFLRTLEYSSGNIQLKFELVPVDFDMRTMSETREIPLEERTDEAGNVAFSEGQIIKVKVINEGSAPAFFTLLDIQPNNHVEVIIPNQTSTPEEYRIMPGQTFIVPDYFRLNPPYGTEVFKLIGTDTPIDLRSVLQTRGRSTRGFGSQNPFEKLVGQTFLGDGTSTRGGSTFSVASSNLNVYSQTFLIVEE